MSKKKSANTNKKNCVKKYTFNENRSEQSSRNVYSADLEDSLGKEKLYFRKITILMFEIIIVAIMKLCLFKTNYANIHFYEAKNKKQHKHSR
jgi:hypothetical protein